MSADSLAVRLLAIFVEELDGQLGELRDALAQLEAAPDARPAVTAVFRVMHTLKGAARAAGVPLVEQLCHVLESELDGVRASGAALSPSMLALLLEAHDALAGARDRLALGESATHPALTAAIQHARGGGRIAPSQAERETLPEVPPSPQPFVAAAVEVPVAAKATSTVASLPETPVAAAAEPREEQLRIAVTQVDAITAATGELAMVGSSLTEHAAEVSSLRATIRARLAPVAPELLRDLEAELNQLARRAQDDARNVGSVSVRLDGAVRRLRQRPVRDLTDILQRIVRDAARELEKSVRVEVEGETIEADRVVIEALREPLLHLLRNAVDHGIEEASSRMEAGKSPEGIIRIAATLRGDRLILTITDDGGGLNLEAIRTAHRRRGAHGARQRQRRSSNDLR